MPTSCLADRPVGSEERRHSGLKEERRDSGLKEERTHSGLKEERTKEERTHSGLKEERAKEERTHSIPKEEHRHSGEHHGHHAKEALAAGTPTRLLDREGSAKFAAPRQGSAPCLARQAPGAAPSCSIVLGALTALRAGHCISPGSVFRRVSTRPLGPAVAQCMGCSLAPKQVATLCRVG